MTPSSRNVKLKCPLDCEDMITTDHLKNGQNVTGEYYRVAGNISIRFSEKKLEKINN